MKFTLIFSLVLLLAKAAWPCSIVIPQFGDVTWPTPGAEDIALNIEIDIQRTFYESDYPELRLLDDENNDVPCSVDDTDSQYLRLTPDQLANNTRYTLISTQRDEERELTTFVTGDETDDEPPAPFDIAIPEHTIVRAGESTACAPSTREDRLSFNVPESREPDADFVRGELFDAYTDERIHSTLFNNSEEPYWSTLRYTLPERQTSAFYIDFIDGSGNRTRSNTVTITPTGCSSLKTPSSNLPLSALFLLLLTPILCRRQSD